MIWFMLIFPPSKILTFPSEQSFLKDHQSVYTNTLLWTHTLHKQVTESKSEERKPYVLETAKETPHIGWCSVLRSRKILCGSKFSNHAFIIFNTKQGPMT